jgi:hypothetical protein
MEGKEGARGLLLAKRQFARVRDPLLTRSPPFEELTMATRMRLAVHDARSSAEPLHEQRVASDNADPASAGSATTVPPIELWTRERERHSWNEAEDPCVAAKEQLEMARLRQITAPGELVTKRRHEGGVRGMTEGGERKTADGMMWRRTKTSLM